MSGGRAGPPAAPRSPGSPGASGESGEPANVAGATPPAAAPCGSDTATAGSVDYRTGIPPVAEFERLLAGTGWFAGDPPTRDQLAGALSTSWIAVGAYAGGRLVGVGRVVGDGVLHGLIADVIVEPAWQGRGVGTAVVERLIAACAAAGVRDVQLFCATGKRPFYERLGFRARPHDAPGMELERR